MDVTLIDRQLGYRVYSVVADAGRVSFTVRHGFVKDWWQVVNHNGRHIGQGTSLFTRIVQACEEYADAMAL